MIIITSCVWMGYTYVVMLIMNKLWKKLLKHFCDLKMNFFWLVFKIIYIKKDCNFHVNEQHSKHYDIVHLFLTTSEVFYYLWTRTWDWTNCDKIEYLVALGRGSKGRNCLICLFSILSTARLWNIVNVYLWICL